MKNEERLQKALDEAHKAMDELIKEYDQNHIVVVDVPMYENKSQLARTFGLSRQTINNYYPEFEEIERNGRYSSYAILEGRANVAAFADFLKYRRWFKDANLKKHIPIFKLQDALNMLIP